MQRIFKALLVAAWFMVLTFPIMGIKINTLTKSVAWRWDRVALIGAAVFFLSLLWHWCFARKARGLPIIALPQAPLCLRQDPLPTATEGRRPVRKAQGLASHRHTLRSMRPHLLLSHRHRRYRHLLAATMSPEPRAP